MQEPPGSPKSGGAGRRPNRVFLSLLVLMLLQRGVETVGSVKALELAGYQALQLALDWSPRVPARFLVIDISDLPPEAGITPREKLFALLTALKDANARAIGIDIDFSPEHNVFVTPEDPAFLERCRTLGIPVFLGVGRAAGSSREAWLGRREFADMAAAIIVPEASGTAPHGGAPGPYPMFIPQLGAGVAPAELPSMALRLASVWNPDIEGTLTPDFWFEPIVERSVGNGRAIPEFTVDYSFIRELRGSSISARWNTAGQLTTSFDPAVVGDSLVLVGDLRGSSESDIFTAAGITGKASGVLLHASATLTLLTGPLSSLREWLRTAIDILLLALVPFCLSHWAKTPKQHLGILLAVAMVVLAGTGVALVKFRILWYGWLPVLVLGAMHAVVKFREDASADIASKEEEVGASV